MVQDEVLIHASPKADLDALLPASRGATRKLVYATCCPVFAVFHVLRRKYDYPILLYSYSLFSIRFVLFVTPSDIYEKLLSTRVTFYYVARSAFYEDARTVGLVERISLGLIRNTNVEYITDRIVRPVSTTSISVGDLLPRHALRVSKYRIQVSFKCP